MNNIRLLLSTTLCLAFCAAATPPLFAAHASGDPLVETILTLLADKDKDLRAVALQQVREEVKGPAATRQFAALLPKLPPENQAALLLALGDRGDAAAKPAVLEMLKSPAEPVRTAAVRALGPLGDTTDVPLLLGMMFTAGPDKAVARESLVRLRGQPINAAIVAQLKKAKPAAQTDLIALLVARRAVDTLPSLLAAAVDADPAVRAAAMAALGQMAATEQVPGMVQGVLKAAKGNEREAAERAIVAVCGRIEDSGKRAEPLLAAMAKLSDEDQNALLPTLGRVGSPPAMKVIEAAMAGDNAARREAGFHAFCNWPDGSIAQRLLDLAKTAPDAEHRNLARRALIRVAPLPDKRSNEERLAMVKKSLAAAVNDEERNLVLKRARAVRTVETLRFLLPYLDNPVFAQEACMTIVELAHHRALREPNKAEFDPALDAVIRISKDAVVVDRAKRYKRGETWAGKKMD